MKRPKKRIAKRKKEERILGVGCTADRQNKSIPTHIVKRARRRYKNRKK